MCYAMLLEIRFKEYIPPIIDSGNLYTVGKPWFQGIIPENLKGIGAACAKLQQSDELTPKTPRDSFWRGFLCIATGDVTTSSPVGPLICWRLMTSLLSRHVTHFATALYGSGRQNKGRIRAIEQHWMVEGPSNFQGLILRGPRICLYQNLDMFYQVGFAL